MLRLVVIALLALLAVPGASAEPPAETATPATSDASADKVVCVREMPVGSQIPVRRCRTQRQIDAQRDAVQKALQRPISEKGNN